MMEEELRQEHAIRIQRNWRMRLARQALMVAEEARAALEFEQDWSALTFPNLAPLPGRNPSKYLKNFAETTNHEN